MDKLLQETMAALEALGNPQTKAIWMRHGAREPFFGVKVGDLKPLAKRHKGQHALALALYRTGNSDAMYLAGLLSDPSQMTPALLDEWAEGAYWYMLSEYAVAWTCAESPHALDRALAWIAMPEERMASAGWATLASWLGIAPEAAIDLALIDRLLAEVSGGIHQTPNRVRYAMNGFVIAVGAYVPARTAQALEAARKIGKVEVSMGDTACKVPEAASYIQKIEGLGKIGKKRKTAKC